jgi:hypothetical protein
MHDGLTATRVEDPPLEALEDGDNLFIALGDGNMGGKLEEKLSNRNGADSTVIYLG